MHKRVGDLSFGFGLAKCAGPLGRIWEGVERAKGTWRYETRLDNLTRRPGWGGGTLRAFRRAALSGLLVGLVSCWVVEWDSRKFNSSADHAANVALDSKGDFHVGSLDALAAALPRNACVRLSVDGAKRGDGSSAGGMAIMVYGDDGTPQLMYRAGRIFDTQTSAFVAELLALEWAFSVFLEFVYKASL